ncbi:MAG: DNA gyrase inhibitor YacG [Commensalibacter sp.]|nr:DNA gyrase inhibitor YacG [Commensalibacter sp.]
MSRMNNLHCPICNKPSQFAFRPFCSKRCADIDLGQWFSGQYCVGTPPQNEEEEKKLCIALQEKLDPDG